MINNHPSNGLYFNPQLRFECPGVSSTIASQMKSGITDNGYYKYSFPAYDFSKTIDTSRYPVIYDMFNLNFLYMQSYTSDVMNYIMAFIYFKYTVSTNTVSFDNGKLVFIGNKSWTTNVTNASFMSYDIDQTNKRFNLYIKTNTYGLCFIKEANLNDNSSILNNLFDTLLYKTSTLPSGTTNITNKVYVTTTTS